MGCPSIAYWTLNANFCVTVVEKEGAEASTKGKEILNEVFACAVCSFMFLSTMYFNRVQRDRNRMFLATE